MTITANNKLRRRREREREKNHEEFAQVNYTRQWARESLGYPSWLASVGWDSCLLIRWEFRRNTNCVTKFTNKADRDFYASDIRWLMNGGFFYLHSLWNLCKTRVINKENEDNVWCALGNSKVKCRRLPLGGEVLWRHVAVP